MLRTMLAVTTVATAAACVQGDEGSQTEEADMPSNTAQPIGDTFTINPPVPDGVDGFRYVLIEDISEEGQSVQIDAVSVLNAETGEERFATRVVEHRSRASESSQDAARMLGPPDSQCTEESAVYDLGGQFGYAMFDMIDIIRSRDIVIVYDRSRFHCSPGEGGYPRVSLGRDVEGWNFVEIGVGLTRSYTVP